MAATPIKPKKKPPPVVDCERPAGVAAACTPKKRACPRAAAPVFQSLTAGDAKAGLEAVLRQKDAAVQPSGGESAMDIDWPKESDPVTKSERKCKRRHAITTQANRAAHDADGSCREARRPRKPVVEVKTGADLRTAVLAFMVTASVTQVFLELFSGSARMTSSFIAGGIASFAVDILQGYDLCRDDLRDTVIAMIGEGILLGVWLATPCHGLGRARRGRPWKQRLARGITKGWPAPIRGPAHVWGLPDEELCPKDRAILAQSNALVRVSLRIFEACCHAGVPVGMENPARSYLWSLPEVQAVMDLEGSTRVTLDFCGYGESWQKATTMLFNGWTGVESLSRRCHPVRCGKGVPCLCSFRGIPHVILSGICREKKTWWTSIAEPYPWPLTEAIAQVFRAMHPCSP